MHSQVQTTFLDHDRGSYMPYQDDSTRAYMAEQHRIINSNSVHPDKVRDSLIQLFGNRE
jgi:hypothetical protein